MMRENRTKLEFTEKLMIRLGAYLKNKLKQGFDISRKNESKEFVTNVDIELEKLIVDAINQNFKDQKFFGEENERCDDLSGDVWIIDPIDGTSNFIHQGKDFSISIAYYKDFEPIFGVVYDVMADELFVGIANIGAYLNGVQLEKTSNYINYDDIIFGGRFIVFDFLDLEIVSFHNKISGHRNISSSALEICHVASGRLHMYVSQGLRIWDIAAANIILNEVNGVWRFGDSHNKLKLVDEKARYFSAANPQLFDYLSSKIID